MVKAVAIKFKPLGPQKPVGLLLSTALLGMLSAPASAQPAAASSPFGPAFEQMQQDYAQAALIRRFYEAFARHDGDAMVACYHPQVEFYDPVFGLLKGREAGAMWQMLLAAGGEQLKVKASNISAHQGKGQADWQAWYTFSATGLPVHNLIHAEFEFKDGLIYRHRDHFDFYRWSSMALGPMGSLLGATPLVQGTIQKRARESLDAYLANQPVKTK